MKRIHVAEKVVENLFSNNIKLQKKEKILVYTDKLLKEASCLI